MGSETKNYSSLLSDGNGQTKRNKAAPGTKDRVTEVSKAGTVWGN